MEQLKREKGEKKTAENVRYGQNLSESGFGGETTASGGSASQGKVTERGCVSEKLIRSQLAMVASQLKTKKKKFLRLEVSKAMVEAQV